MPAPSTGGFREMIEGVTGRNWQTLQREWMVVAGAVGPFGELPGRMAGSLFAMRRRVVLREVLGVCR